MAAQLTLSDPALKVLDTLRESAADGYTVMGRTGLTPDQLSTALKEIPTSLLMVKGELNPERVGEAYLAIPPDARKYAEFLVRS
jgi:hypothetical protein